LNRSVGGIIEMESRKEVNIGKLPEVGYSLNGLNWADCPNCQCSDIHYFKKSRDVSILYCEQCGWFLLEIYTRYKCVVNALRQFHESIDSIIGNYEQKKVEDIKNLIGKIKVQEVLGEILCNRS